jgi:oxalate decarboxylase
MSEFTRRSFIGKTAVAIGSFAALQKVVGADRSKSDPGPANPALDGQNPDSTWPPSTDSKSLVQNFKYPFSFANKRTYEGGWSREVTVRELPVSRTLAGVNMRLTAGGFRELHWHTAGEWAIMLTETHGLPPSIWTAKVSSPMWAKMIFGFFHQEFLTPFKA